MACGVILDLAPQQGSVRKGLPPGGDPRLALRGGTGRSSRVCCSDGRCKGPSQRIATAASATNKPSRNGRNFRRQAGVLLFYVGPRAQSPHPFPDPRGSDRLPFGTPAGNYDRHCTERLAVRTFELVPSRSRHPSCLSRQRRFFSPVCGLLECCLCPCPPRPAPPRLTCSRLRNLARRSTDLRFGSKSGASLDSAWPRRTVARDELSAVSSE